MTHSCFWRDAIQQSNRTLSKRLSIYGQQEKTWCPEMTCVCTVCTQLVPGSLLIICDIYSSNDNHISWIAKMFKYFCFCRQSPFLLLQQFCYLISHINFYVLSIYINVLHIIQVLLTIHNTKRLMIHGFQALCPYIYKSWTLQSS